MSGFYKGVAAEQETLYTSADRKLMRDTKFPPSFEAKVDMKKVNIEDLKMSMLEEAVEASKSTDSHNEVALDPKKVQLNLTGFLESKASEFTEELWMLILSASQNPYGIPEKFIQEKKEELSKLRSQRDVSESEAKKEIDRSLHPAEEHTSREGRYRDVRERPGTRPRREPRKFTRREQEGSSYERERSPRRYRNSRYENDPYERPYSDRHSSRSYRSSHRPRTSHRRHEDFDEFGRSIPSERRDSGYYSRRQRSRSPYDSEEERFSGR